MLFSKEDLRRLLMPLMLEQLLAVTIGMMDTINVSARMKLLKPQPEIYLRTLEEHHLPADECLFIDDLAENIAGAEAVGIHGHRFVGAVELERYLGSKSLL